MDQRVRRDPSRIARPPDRRRDRCTLERRGNALSTSYGAPSALRETANTRSIQAGYDFLSKGTGFSRKTIQRTIDRLIAKHYIEIETPADIYRRTATVYRVFGTDAVLDRLARRDCTHVAKIGPGVAFVTPLVIVRRAPGYCSHFRFVHYGHATCVHCRPILSDARVKNEVTTVDISKATLVQIQDFS